MPKIMRVKSGYARDNRRYEVRPMTFEEVLSSGGSMNVLNGNGEMVTVKVNGKVKTWKTRPGDCRVPWKFGMYNYGYVSFTNGTLDHGCLLPVVVIRELSESENV